MGKDYQVIITEHLADIFESWVTENGWALSAPIQFRADDLGTRIITP